MLGFFKKDKAKIRELEEKLAKNALALEGKSMLLYMRQKEVLELKDVVEKLKLKIDRQDSDYNRYMRNLRRENHQRERAILDLLKGGGENGEA